MAARECPARDALAGYVYGTLAEGDLDDVADHVDACPGCAETVCRLEETVDGMLSHLRDPPPRDDLTDEQDYREVVALLAGLRSPSRDHRDQAPATTPLPRTLPCRIRAYELQELLGQGGMGTVYRARHLELDKTVAVKVLSAERLRDDRAVARFKREMRAIGRLEHPNIVRAMDAGDESGTHYLVTEFVDGRDLSHLVAERGALPVADACEIVRQAAAGLQHAHEHGLVHRDIKPANLILARNGVVKVLDLGLALLDEGRLETGELTSSGHIIGTIDYMAPEQGVDTHAVDIRADIFGLGGTLYKLLTGQAPFCGPRYDTVLKKLAALAAADATPVREFRPDVPRELESLVHRMLAKTPDRRPASPAEVVKLLEPFTAGADLVALLEGRTARIDPDDPHLVSGAEQAARQDAQSLPLFRGGIAQFIRANPIASAIGVVLMGLLLAAGWIGLVQNSSAPALPEAATDDPSGRSDVAELSTFDGQPVLIEIEEPPPLELWLAGRHIITVAQNGNADHRTINAALAAVQPGDVVEVLDAGPYLERFEYVDMPADIGLISRAGTMIQLNEWHTAVDAVRGHVFWKLNGFRFSGLRFLYDHQPAPGNVIAFHASGSGTTVVEDCEFLGRGRLSDRPEGSGIYANCANGGLAVVRDCLLTGTLHVGPSRSDTTTLICRNLFIGIEAAQVSLNGFAPGVHRLAIRENVAFCPEPRGSGIFMQPLWPDRPGQAVRVANNTILTPQYGLLVRNHAPHLGVQLVNNVLGHDGIRLDELPPEDWQHGLPRWDVRSNAYRNQTTDAMRHLQTSTTYTGAIEFLSTDPGDDNFLRIPPDSPLATAGAGGGMPTYIGALPPGPAPAEGDWFSRLVDRWRHAQEVLTLDDE